jgi:hypothetical protein
MVDIYTIIVVVVTLGAVGIVAAVVDKVAEYRRQNNL